MSTLTPPTEIEAASDVAPAAPPAPAASSALLSSLKRWDAVLVFLITLIAYGVFVPRMVSYLTPVSGDEPYYLMTAYSLIEDGDINECNNFRQHDFDKLYPDFIVKGQPTPADWVGWTSIPYPLPLLTANIDPPRGCNLDPTQPSNSDGQPGELYSLHGLGLSLMILPALAVAGRIGVVYFLVILGSLLAANIYLLAREGTGRRLPALLTWLAFTFTVPMFAYSLIAFTELPAALLLIYALRRIRLWQNNWLQMLGIGFCIGFLPSLHYRYITFSVILFVYYIYQAYRDRAALRQSLTGHIVALLMMVGGAILLVVRDYIVYHQLLPGSELYASTDQPLMGFFGNFLDQQDGLFIVAPVMILTLVGIIMMVMRKGWRIELLWLALLFIPHFTLVSEFIIWWGSWCPPARYMVSTLPLFVLPFALAMDQIRLVWYKLIYGLLMLPTLGWLAVYINQPQWMYVQGHNEFLVQVVMPFFARQTNQPIENFNAANWLPSFTNTYFFNNSLSSVPMIRQAWQVSLGIMAIIAFIVILCLALYWWQGRKPRSFVSFSDTGAAMRFTPPPAPPLRIAPRLLALYGGGLVALLLVGYVVYNVAAKHGPQSVAVSQQTLTPLPTPTTLRPQLIVPAGALNLVKPQAVAVDEGGNVYIGDSGTMSISKYTPVGHFINSWTVFGGPNGDQGRQLVDIAVYKDQLYVTASGTKYIEVYSTDGKAAGQRTASGSDQMVQPMGLCLDGNGNLYVADNGSQRILKLDGNDHLISTIGASDALTPEQRLNGASDCVVDAADGSIYATDSQQRLMKYNASGGFVAQWRLSLNGDMKHLALDGGHLYISDPGSNTVVVFDTATQKMTAYGGPGNDPGQFSGLVSLATAGNGKLYTVEMSNAWVQVFAAP